MAGDEGDDAAAVTERHVLVSVLGDHPKTKILAAFLGNPDIDFNRTKIADYAGLESKTVNEHLDTLRGWGMIEETQQSGDSRQYSLNTDSEAAETLAKFEWKLVDHLGQKEQQGEVDDMNNPLP